MSKLYDEFLESQQTKKAIEPVESSVTREPAPTEVVYVEPNTVNIISPPSRSGIGSIIAGLLLSATAVVGGYVYLTSIEKSSETIERENSDEDTNTVVGPVSNIYGLSGDVPSGNTSASTTVLSSGCERQLSSVEDVVGAYTRTGSNTDLCWEIGESVSTNAGNAGVVTFWGESPYAGKLDDDLIREKFTSSDITSEELHAFFKSFVIDTVAETKFILIDRSGDNYQWPVGNSLENVVVSIKENQG